MTVSVVIAEDHPMFREGLRALLDAHPGLDVVAAVAGGHAAVTAVKERSAEVAVLDLSMPDGGGLEAASAIRSMSPTTRILVLTSSNTEAEVSAALAAGAHGYLLKSAGPDEITEAVLAVASGSAVLADDVLAMMTQRAVGQSHRANRRFPELTDRELDVLLAIADGLDNTQIADRLGLSPKTVRNYVSNILVKLGVRDRAAAVVEVHRRGVQA